MKIQSENLKPPENKARKEWMTKDILKMMNERRTAKQDNVKSLKPTTLSSGRIAAFESEGLWFKFRRRHQNSKRRNTRSRMHSPHIGR
jgi:hypothetical protein